jgi:asparagine synthase (glutamine-hydrolysing)
MCGISGIINRKNLPVEANEIKKMNDLVAHRGPDDEGFFFGDNFALGHRRLSIIDLTSDAHQPMTYNNKYTITYNGEIYNYIEIKGELINAGYVFHSKSDTEVILAAYDKWGYDCLSRFNGMWSFAIFDQEKKIFFCSRDRFGVKPFYYTETEGKFIFGSEIKQMLEFMPNRFVNKNVLIDYLLLGFEEHTNETFFENIHKLEQSHYMVYNLITHRYEIKKYYEIAIDNKLKAFEGSDAVDTYRENLTSSIKLRLRSDVKVGTCLSGGLDSSSVASIAALNYSGDGKFLAIHAKSSEQASDESRYAEVVSDCSNLDLHIIEPSEKDFHENIDEVIYAQEEPFGGPSVFMQYFVMKKSKELNCKVLLDGQGGDETLLGYERYYAAFLKEQSFFAKIKLLFASSKNSKLSVKQLIQFYIYFTNPKLRFLRLVNKRSYINKHYLSYASKAILLKSSKSYLNIMDLQNLEIMSLQLPHLLRYEDKNSMRNSVETRLPFIDFRAVETALSLNNKYKIKEGWTKYILRKALEKEKVLPYEIIWRKNKFGFEAPSRTWINSLDIQLAELINNSKILSTIIDHKKLNMGNIDTVQKWKLFNIAKWEKVFNVEI